MCRVHRTPDHSPRGVLCRSEKSRKIDHGTKRRASGDDRNGVALSSLSPLATPPTRCLGSPVRLRLTRCLSPPSGIRISVPSSLFRSPSASHCLSTHVFLLSSSPPSFPFAASSSLASSLFTLSLADGFFLRLTSDVVLFSRCTVAVSSILVGRPSWPFAVSPVRQRSLPCANVWIFRQSVGREDSACTDRPDYHIRRSRDRIDSEARGTVWIGDMGQRRRPPGLGAARDSWR